MYRLRGMGVAPADCQSGSSIWCAKNTDCSSGVQWAVNPGCWSMTPSEWAQYGRASQVVAPGPPAPTTQQLQAVSSGQMTADQLTQQLANEQATGQQAANEQNVQPDTSAYATAGSIAANLSCAQTIAPPMCDWTIYLIGGGLAVLALMMSMR